MTRRRAISTTALGSRATLLLDRMSSRRSAIRAVTFDLDDTLWDTMEVIGSALDVFHAHIEKAAPGVGAMFPRPAFSREMAKTGAAEPDIAHDYTALRRRTLARCAAEAGLAGAAIPPLVDGAFEAFVARRCSPALFPEVQPALAALRERGLVLGAITNGNAELRRIAELRDVLGFCVSAGEAGEAKPAPAPFKLAQRRCAVPKEAILHVGDNYEADVQGAKAAGFGHAVLVLAGFDGSGRDAFPEADAIVRDMSELVSVLDQLDAAVAAAAAAPAAAS